MRTLVELTEALAAGTLSATDAVDAVLTRIHAHETTLGAFVELRDDAARAAAHACDSAGTDATPHRPLAGVPIALKDNMCEKNISCQCASRVLEGYRPPYNATVVQKLVDAGAIIVGRTNMDEFAMGSSTEFSAAHLTRNPWDTSRIPGGSSGGAATAVAARMLPAALGTDTGGSIRQPAAFCGVTGLKPTYGRVSRYGLVAFASSLDQIGPITLTAEDAALLLSVIAGRDPRDATSAHVPVPDYRAACHAPLAGKKIGIPREYFSDGISPAVSHAVRAALDIYADAGADVQEISLPHTPYAVATYYVICTAEASSNLARYDGVRYGRRAADVSSLEDLYTTSRTEGFGPEVFRRILLGTYVLSAGYYDAYYLKAQKVRTRICEDFTRAFADVDMIVTPTTPSVAFAHGEKIDDPIAMYLGDIFTVSVNLAGVPAISIPCGFSPENLPIGMQIIAPHFQEEMLFSAAHTFQSLTDFHTRTPPCAVADDALTPHTL